MVFDFEGFNWGKFAGTTLPDEFKSGLYGCFSKVKDEDVIVDIGAGVGAVPWFILTNNKKPKRIHMVEPYPPNQYIIKQNLQALKKNFPGLSDSPENICSIINHSISDKDGPHQISWGYNPIVSSLTFKTLQSEYFGKVDFLKIDIEGDEYHIFQEENIEYINNVTGVIHCEFHLNIEGGPNKKIDLRNKFRFFRDHVLPKIEKQYEVYSIDGINIKWDLWNEHFIEYYGCVIFIFDNG